MAKVLSLICAAAPKAPARYLAKLPRVQKLWSGAGWDVATFGTLDVATVPPTPRAQKLYPWRIHTVVRFSGMAKPKRDWTALRDLAEAVLDDVGGVLAESKVVVARLPGGARASLWRAIEDALGEPTLPLAEALSAATAWNDPLTDEEIAARLEETLRQQARIAPYETLVQLGGDHGARPGVERWLGAPLGEGTRLELLLERADESGLRLGPLASERLRQGRRRRWLSWAFDSPPSRSDVAEIVAEAARGELRGRTVLAQWCELHVAGAERAPLVRALARASAVGGPWPEAVREAARPLIWKSEDEPFPHRDVALHATDAQWVAGELAARAEERRRYAELVAGINERNAARFRQM
jgi:hypothetical protein